MKYYSEKLNRLFDNEASLKEAENKEISSKKEDEKKILKKEEMQRDLNKVEEALEKAEKASVEAYAELARFYKKYGSDSYSHNSMQGNLDTKMFYELLLSALS